MRRPAITLDRYLLAVCAAGLVLLGGLCVVDGPEVLARASVTLGVLVVLVVASELLPITLPRRHGPEQITISTAFAFAVLLSFGVTASAAALAVASLVADAVDRKPVRHCAFNVAQYVLSVAASGLLLGALSDVPYARGIPFAPHDLPAIVVAGAAFFIANNVLAGAVGALAQGLPVLAYLREDLAFQAATASMLLGIAPIVVIASDFSLLAIPLLALPVLAVYAAGRQAALNEHQALHDALTDLPNRVLFRDRVAQAVLHARREHGSVAVLALDLDRFKEINDTLGHRCGDLLLRDVALRLEHGLRESDTVARLGGDEFGILLSRVDGPDAVLTVVRECVASLEAPFVVAGVALDATASVGIACFPQHAKDADRLIQRADAAMYSAKEAGGGVEVYEPDHDRHSPERLALVSDLRRALDVGELALDYQPKVEVHTGAVVGVEALVRWRHPTRGVLNPDEFIPLAERTGLIRPLTTYVLRAALEQCRGWRAEGLELTVAVNLSVRSLLDRQLPDDVRDLLARNGLPAGCLILEITESSFMSDTVRSLLVLDELSAMGVRLSVDDFGTGYSSLAYLKRLPVDELKIDRSFVRDLESDDGDAVIVRSTVDLGHNLGLEIVAEGVESAAVLARLATLGCDLAQGYHLSRPVPADELAAWVRARQGGLAPALPAAVPTP